MAYFDRFDICEAYLALEWDYNIGGILRERPSNIRRRMSTGFQLHRMGFKPAPGFDGYASLSENGREIYDDLIRRYGLPTYKDDLDHYILDDDQPTTCPKCCARTGFIEAPEGWQMHTCPQCGYGFVAEHEESDD